jgi:hypothetical protein
MDRLTSKAHAFESSNLKFLAAGVATPSAFGLDVINFFGAPKHQRMKGGNVLVAVDLHVPIFRFNSNRPSCRAQTV